MLAAATLAEAEAPTVCRHTDAQNADHHVRREAILVRRGEVAPGGKGGDRRSTDKLSVGYAKRTAADLGVDERTVRRDLARGKNIAPDVLADVGGTTLASLVAEARAYAANIAPAQAAFDAADEAWVKSTDKVLDRALGAQRAQLEQAWSDHVDRFLSIAEKILTLPATTPDALWRHVRTYAELLDPIVGEQDYDTALQRLPKESLLTIIDRLINEHAGVVSLRARRSGL